MSKGEKLYNKATKLALQEEYNPREVIELLETAIEKYHNGKAAYALATWYFFGKHVRKSYKKAFDLIKIAVEQEPSQLSCYNIAVSYESGKGTEKNLEKAFQYYLLSALYEYKQAIAEVCRCFYYGIGVAKNKELGLEIKKYFNTDITNMSKGEKLYNKATKLALQEEYNPREVIELLETAIEKYLNGKAAYALATWYLFGKHVKKNYKKAFALLQIAVQQEPDKKSCYDIAVSYELGKGIEKNPEKAFQYYLFSAFYGDQQAMYEVGRCFYYGIGVAKNKDLGLTITHLFETPGDKSSAILSNIENK